MQLLRVLEFNSEIFNCMALRTVFQAEKMILDFIKLKLLNLINADFITAADLPEQYKYMHMDRENIANHGGG